ncbi:hypothetical protein [Caballeronia sp. M1242]|uniref:hypothetical protein n=1 Tax=Caballeronia sp. M1242 TaxID=2814653 RepID=UPI00353042BF
MAYDPLGYVAEIVDAAGRSMRLASANRMQACPPPCVRGSFETYAREKENPAHFAAAGAA